MYNLKELLNILENRFNKWNPYYDEMDNLINYEELDYIIKELYKRIERCNHCGGETDDDGNCLEGEKE